MQWSTMSAIKMDNNELPELLRADCPYRYKLCECGAFDCPCMCDCETCADREKCMTNDEQTNE